MSGSVARRRPIADSRQTAEVDNSPDGVFFEPSLQLFQVKRQVLNFALSELNVGIADAASDLRRVATRYGQHFVIHIHAEDLPGRPDHLAREKTYLSRARPEIQHRFTRMQMVRGVAAPVIALQNFVGNGGKEF